MDSGWKVFIVLLSPLRRQSERHANVEARAVNQKDRF